MTNEAPDRISEWAEYVAQCLTDTLAPSRENAHTVCPDCGDTGMRDSGGVYPWGEHIDVPCDCDAASREKVHFISDSMWSRPVTEPQPTPSPEPEPVAWMIRDELGVRLFKNIDSANKVARLGGNVVQALYASTPTPASHAEELRKAKAEAWDQGFSACEDPNLDIRCNPYHSTGEGGE